MKLFYFPDACSLAPHIALRETRQAFTLAQVDYGTKRLDDGTDYRTLNPKGSVPALVLDDGEVLTEVAVMLQFIAAQSPGSTFVPADRGLLRWRCLEWLNYIATELHKSVSPLYRASTPESFRQPGLAHLATRFDLVEAVLARQAYLCGSQYTIADMYLFVICRWLPALKIDTARWPAAGRFYARVAQRPTVEAALAAEGLADDGFIDDGKPVASAAPE